MEVSIPKRPLKDHARENGTERVRDEAAEEIIEEAKEYIDQLIEVGSGYAEAADRVTLMKDDVQLAKEIVRE